MKRFREILHSNIQDLIIIPKLMLNVEKSDIDGNYKAVMIEHYNSKKKLIQNENKFLLEMINNDIPVIEFTSKNVKGNNVIVNNISELTQFKKEYGVNYPNIKLKSPTGISQIFSNPVEIDNGVEYSFNQYKLLIYNDSKKKSSENT